MVAGKTFPAFPAHAQTAILRIWQETHCRMSSGWLMILPYVIRVTQRNLITKPSGWLSYWQHLIRMTYGQLTMSSGWHTNPAPPKSSGWHNVIWSLSHPDDSAIGSISSGWLMANLLCHPDDIWISQKSSGWHNVIWSQVIRMTYSQCLDDLRWHTLPFYIIRVT